FGGFENIEKSTEESMLTVDMTELTPEGELKENGLELFDSSISLKVIKDENIKKELVGLEINTIKDIDLKLAYPNDTELSSLLGVSKEDLDKLSNLFRITIKLIKEYRAAELNQELFDKVFGENAVSSEAEFVEKIKEEMQSAYLRETKYKLFLDAKEAVIKKTNMTLPEAFLERWIKVSNKELTEEQIKNEFPRFIEDLKWTLIKTNIAKTNEFKVNDEDLENVAKEQLRAQFVQYGMSNIPEDILDKYAKESLQNKEELNKFYERAIEDKVVDFIIDEFELEEKEISLDEFYKLFN
ncbi:MAG: hypothetical protein M0P36_10200, partial [Bacteroidales bacterium]|nr:hypothetical protein [Bacteroidales bacterium]